MKIGDKVPVQVAGHVVAQAEVKEMADGTVTLVVPATLAVMELRTDIAGPGEETPQEGGTTTEILGVEENE